MNLCICGRLFPHAPAAGLVHGSLNCVFAVFPALILIPVVELFDEPGNILLDPVIILLFKLRHYLDKLAQILRAQFLRRRLQQLSAVGTDLRPLREALFNMLSNLYNRRGLHSF